MQWKEYEYVMCKDIKCKVTCLKISISKLQNKGKAAGEREYLLCK